MKRFLLEKKFLQNNYWETLCKVLCITTTAAASLSRQLRVPSKQERVGNGGSLFLREERQPQTLRYLIIRPLPQHP